jgi:hypothetical protein
VREHRREEPRREEPRREEPVALAPRIDARQALDDSGLVMVETDHSKVRVQPQVIEEAQPAGRPRRERTTPVAQDEELKQVETTRK